MSGRSLSIVIDFLRAIASTAARQSLTSQSLLTGPFSSVRLPISNSESQTENFFFFVVKCVENVGNLFSQTPMNGVFFRRWCIGILNYIQEFGSSIKGHAVFESKGFLRSI